MTLLIDRATEQERLGVLLAGAASGFSGSLVLRGQPGVGKTALLEDTLTRASDAGMTVVQLTGLESETKLGYAALHRVIRPFMHRLDALPQPQRDALRSSLGLTDEVPANKFLVALSVLTLLTDIASEHPLLCAVDDAHWLDIESAAVLGFVAQRLHADPVAVLFCVRDPLEVPAPLTGLPIYAIDGLSQQGALDLLHSVTPGWLSPEVATRLVAETMGLPLALIELARELSPEQLAGASPLPNPLPVVAGSVERMFGQRVSRLPYDAQRMLALVAAEPTGSLTLFWRAAEEIGIDPSVIDSADLDDLIELSPHVAFRHPLVRSIAYHSLPSPERRLIHRALAASADSNGDPDRATWHLAEAALGPDDDVADRLEAAAARARARGTYAVTGSLLTRAAELSSDRSVQTKRFLDAAESTLGAGQPVAARGLLERAKDGLETVAHEATALRISGEIDFATGRMADASSMLLSAARALMPFDPIAGRHALLQALCAANYVGCRAIESVFEGAKDVLPDQFWTESPTTVTDGALVGFLHRLGGDVEKTALHLQRAVDSWDEDGTVDLRLTLLLAGSYASTELLDDDSKTRLAELAGRLARDQGALPALALILQGLARIYVRHGCFDLADSADTERGQILALTQHRGLLAQTSTSDLSVLVWRGRAEEARAAAAVVNADVAARGLGEVNTTVQTWLTVLELGLRNYSEALRHARAVYDEDQLSLGILILPDLVEAATRCEELELADSALRRLASRAEAGGAAWGLGLLARCRGLCADTSRAESFYQSAIELLKTTKAQTDLARSHLVYGEWLRRQRRRYDARRELQIAYDMFVDMGAEAFAERARLELEATGEHARRRTVDAANQLTPQEAQIARLVSEGHSNRDVASQLFISASTVDYHLRKVFRKIGVKSRSQLIHHLVVGSNPSSEEFSA